MNSENGYSQILSNGHAPAILRTLPRSDPDTEKLESKRDIARKQAEDALDKFSLAEFVETRRPVNNAELQADNWIHQILFWYSDERIDEEYQTILENMRSKPGIVETVGDCVLMMEAFPLLEWPAKIRYQHIVKKLFILYFCQFSSSPNAQQVTPLSREVRLIIETFLFKSTYHIGDFCISSFPETLAFIVSFVVDHPLESQEKALNGYWSKTLQPELWPELFARHYKPTKEELNSPSSIAARPFCNRFYTSREEMLKFEQPPAPIPLVPEEYVDTDEDEPFVHFDPSKRSGRDTVVQSSSSVSGPLVSEPQSNKRKAEVLSEPQVTPIDLGNPLESIDASDNARSSKLQLVLKKHRQEESNRPPGLRIPLTVARHRLIPPRSTDTAGKPEPLPEVAPSGGRKFRGFIRSMITSYEERKAGTAFRMAGKSQEVQENTQEREEQDRLKRQQDRLNLRQPGRPVPKLLFRRKDDLG